VAAGRFREDLYYRLNVIDVALPPLRWLRGDIMPLAERLLRSFARQSGKPGAEFTAVAKAVLAKYDWPGNVRELRNAVERGIILSVGRVIDVVHLPTQIASEPPARVELGGTISLESLEAEHMRRVMAAARMVKKLERRLSAWKIWPCVRPVCIRWSEAAIPRSCPTARFCHVRRSSSNSGPNRPRDPRRIPAPNEWR
jgi:DNA-binding NtrC family response regulator